MEFTDANTRDNARAYDEHAQLWDQTIRQNAAYQFLEKPAMAQSLPQDLEHRSVLVIGAGNGDELAELIKQNPRRIAAIDISQKFSDMVRQKFPSVETQVMDMTDLKFPDASFDFVYSGLALHYASDWDRLLRGIHRILKPGGRLLFSTHHPEFWGGKGATGKTVANPRGVVLTEHRAHLHAGVEVTYYNHPNTDSILDAVRHAGFEILRSAVPQPAKLHGKLNPAQQAEYDNLTKRSRQTALFFIVLARRADEPKEPGN